MTDRIPLRRWYIPTPDKVVVALLVWECAIWLSDWLGWPHWHKGYAVLAAIGSVVIVLLILVRWSIAALRVRRQFQFAIRTLLLFTVTVALPLSWLSVAVKNARKQSEVVEEIQKLNGTVDYDDGRTPRPTPLADKVSQWLRSFFANVVRIDLAHTQVTDAGLENFSGLTALHDLVLSDTKVAGIGLANLRGMTALEWLWLDGTQLTDVGLANLRGLKSLQRLWLNGTQVTDTGLENIRELTSLKILRLSGTQITDAGLENLRGLTALRDLTLTETQVDDTGLDKLRGLTGLRLLVLTGTHITDAGLEKLRGMTELQWIFLDGTNVTKAGVDELKKALPNCQFVR